VFGPAVTRPQAIGKLSPGEQAAVTQLKVTDRKVRQHEQAHLAAAGPYAVGGPSYTYSIGPDGYLYATGGEVSMDVAPDPSDPKKTIEKERAVEAAANAPANPSDQDRRVAAQAAAYEQVAERQLDDEKRAAAYGDPDPIPVGQLISAIL
jgi:SprA-related family